MTPSHLSPYFSWHCFLHFRRPLKGFDNSPASQQKNYFQLVGLLLCWEPVYFYHSLILKASHSVWQPINKQTLGHSASRPKVTQTVSSLVNQSVSHSMLHITSQPISQQWITIWGENWQPKESLDSIQASLWSLLLMTDKRTQNRGFEDRILSFFQRAYLIWVADDEVVGCLYDFLLVLHVVSLQLYCCHLTFCPFYAIAFEMLYEIKCK